MVFNDAINKQGIVQDVLFRTGTTVNDFSLADITRYVNQGYNRVASIILNSDGRMQWDDANHADQPIASTDLIANQTNYNVFSSAPTALQDWLWIERVELLDEDGNGYLLDPIDPSTINVAMSEYQNVPSIPNQYDFNGTQIILYPASNYNYTNGLIMYFKRSPSYFSSTDTTKRPGFATIYHEYLSIYAANEWNSIKKNDFSGQGLLQKLELEIGKFYSRRSNYERKKLKRKEENYS